MRMVPAGTMLNCREESINLIQRIKQYLGRTPTKPPNTLCTIPSLAILSQAKRPHVAILIMGLGASYCGKCSIVANSRCRPSTTPYCAYIVATLAIDVSREHCFIILLPNYRSHQINHLTSKDLLNPLPSTLINLLHYPTSLL